MVLFCRNTTIAYNHQHPSMATFFVLSRPSSCQNFPVEGKIGVHYTLWDHILFTGCALKQLYKFFLS